MAPASIARYFGFSLLLLGAAMAPPIVYALSTGDAVAGNYAFAAAATLFSGAGFLTLSTGAARSVNFRSTIMLILLWWTATPVFGALPFWLDGWSLIDGYFEAVSALTTTGATLVEDDLRDKPVDLVWRAVLQWVGGLTSLATAAAIFIRPQFVGADAAQPTFSRGDSGSFIFAIASATRSFAPIYALVTALAFIMIAASGVPTFDAAVLAASSVASGGLTPETSGVSAYPFMAHLAYLPFVVISGASFVVLDRALRGKRLKGADIETPVYCALIVILGVVLWVAMGDHGAAAAFEQLFNAASLFATNGVVIGAEPNLILALVTVIIGGSAVSTAGGLKILRWIVIMRRTQSEVRRLVLPSAVFGPRSVRNELGVWMHFLVFTMALAALTTWLTAGGHTLEAAVAGAVGAVANAGPVIALTPEGHEGYHIFMDPWIRLLLAAAMIVGRLEGVAALMMIRGAFWRS
ncbi:MAG: TrkH family potassium uptake protein [Parvularculaceae bacterium]|nr:TrkH family potassium uptake protein [Parvularculaceae bacterium]